MSDIMEVIDERERQRIDRKKQRSGASYNESES